MTTETGAGQRGAALSYAAKVYGLKCAVYQVKLTMKQKPYRSLIMRTFGASVEVAPSMSHPCRQGHSAPRIPPTAVRWAQPISEAIELTTLTPNCKYTLGSVLNHVSLHQTIIAL